MENIRNIPSIPDKTWLNIYSSTKFQILICFFFFFRFGLLTTISLWLVMYVYKAEAAGDICIHAHTHTHTCVSVHIQVHTRFDIVLSMVARARFTRSNVKCVNLLRLIANLAKNTHSTHSKYNTHTHIYSRAHTLTDWLNKCRTAISGNR